MRRKRSAMEEDEVVVLSTYFVVGDTVFMAPTVSNVIGSRMVCKVIPYAGSVRLLTKHSCRQLHL
jgi:hypothetical protein